MHIFVSTIILHSQISNSHNMPFHSTLSIYLYYFITIIKQNPAEDNDYSSSSAGSTALRLVEAMGVELITGDLSWKAFDYDPEIVPLLWLKIPLTE